MPHACVSLLPEPASRAGPLSHSYAQYVIFFTAGFLILPTGRDFLLPGKPIMPGDDKLIEAMNRDPIQKPCAAFMWRTFGLNFITLSLIKFYVLVQATMMPFYIGFAVYGTIAIGVLTMYKGKFEAEGADITPFLAMFLLETCAWYAIVFS